MHRSTEIKKVEIKETVQFAIRHIPQADTLTLEKFLELIFASGNYGAMSYDAILIKIQQVLRYIPDACPHSLLILTDLLGVPITALTNNPKIANRFSEKDSVIIEASKFEGVTSVLH